MPAPKIVTLFGSAAIGAVLAFLVPGIPAHSDPVLPLPSPSLGLPQPSPSDDGGGSGPLPGAPGLLPDADEPAAPADPTDPPGSGEKGGEKGGKPSATPRPADPDDPEGDRYPHPPFAPIAGNPSAALLQRLYDAQARQRGIRNLIDRTEADLTRASDAVADGKTALAGARRARDAAAEGVRDSVRTIYKSGAPYAVYTALEPSADVGVIRNGTRDRLSAISTAAERVDYLADRFAGAVDGRDALTARLAELKKDLKKATAVVNRYKRAAATDITSGVPNAGVPAGHTGALLWPVRGPVTSEYGNRYDPYYHSWQLHAGIDIAAATGTPVRAAAPGRVVQAGRFGGYGNYICLAHGEVRDQQLTTCYAHLSRILVTTGQTVPAGDSVGQVGSTGASTGPHLHFEVRLGGRPTDPRLWL